MRLWIKEYTPYWKPVSKSFLFSNALENQVYIFKLPLKNLEAHIPELVSFLSTKEQARVKRYRREEDSNRFLICRAVLKLLLSQLIKKPIAEIVIEKNANQKPYLAATDFKFNVAHTSTYGLIAISKSAVGIDVEFIDESYDYQSVLNRVVEGADLNEIQESSTPIATFFKFWTRKEAIVKVSGVGIDDTLIHIPVKNGEHTIDTSKVPALKKDLIVKTFMVSNNHIGSIAFINNEDRRMTCSEFVINDLNFI